MKYRKLGDSGTDVSEIAFGSWLTTSGGVEKDRAIACVHRALDKGITLIDTANAYGRGIAETVIGEALAGLPTSRSGGCSTTSTGRRTTSSTPRVSSVTIISAKAITRSPRR